jgi:hypothetical protein
VIALNMAGSVIDAVDLVVSDVQAGTMAVMAIADTAQLSPASVPGGIDHAAPAHSCSDHHAEEGWTP